MFIYHQGIAKGHPFATIHSIEPLLGRSSWTFGYGDGKPKADGQRNSD